MATRWQISPTRMTAMVERTRSMGTISTVIHTGIIELHVLSLSLSLSFTLFLLSLFLSSPSLSVSLMCQHVPTPTRSDACASLSVSRFISPLSFSVTLSPSMLSLSLTLFPDAGCFLSLADSGKIWSKFFLKIRRC